MSHNRGIPDKILLSNLPFEAPGLTLDELWDRWHDERFVAPIGGWNEKRSRRPWRPTRSALAKALWAAEARGLVLHTGGRELMRPDPQRYYRSGGARMLWIESVAPK
jgi:hypothetical protein